MLQCDVPSYHFRCDLIPNRSYKVPIVPQLPSPQLFFHSWISPKYLPSRDTLQKLYYFARTVSRRTRHKDVHMVCHYFHRIYLQLVSLRNPLKHLLQSLSHCSSEYQFPVLGYPNKMVLQIVNRMLAALDLAHATYRNTTIRLRRISVFLPPASWGVSNGGLL